MKNNLPAKARAMLLRRIAAIHRNDKGAIAILVLLTIWCLVAVLAMTWNTAEYAARKQHLQAAADATANSAATWTARAINVTAAQNMVIAQDAAAQTIWQAVPIVDPQPSLAVNADGSNYAPTARGPDIKRELASELRRATAMLKNPALSKLQKRIAQALIDIANEHDLAQQALATVSANIGQGNFANPQDATDFAKTVRQAGSAIDWVDKVYVNGGSPTAGRPGPPGPNGEGLAQLATDWASKPTNETQILNLIINYINTVELPIIQGPDGSAPNSQSFETITKPALARPEDQIAQAHEQKVYQSQQAVINAVSATVEEQRAKLAAFYKADIAMGMPKSDLQASAPATVIAPVVQADSVDNTLGQGYTDQIRAKYPDEAAAAVWTDASGQHTGLPQTFDIDPINPQTAEAQVWHPNILFSVPGVNGSFTLNCNINGGWGHVWAMPIERYYNDRVNNDKHRLDTDYMVYLDDSRNNRPSDPRDLAYQIRLLMNLPPKTVIADLPGTLVDDQKDDKGVIENIFVLPQLSAPNGTAKFRTQVNLYNQHGGKYTGAVRSLRAALISYTYYFQGFTQSFASDYWNHAVDIARNQVIQQLGTAKTFMVLATYKLRNIPDELKGGLQDSATLSIQDRIIENNRAGVTRAILNAMVAQNPDGAGAGILDASYKQTYLQGYYVGRASQQAIAIMTPLAESAAEEISAEWINRPWPYEITPPKDPSKFPVGMGKDDRLDYFTVLAAARQGDGSSPHLVLSKLFGIQPKLVAYAQAEAFNWMEFNTSYGGSERFDQVSVIPYYDDWGYLPVPRCWRMSTRGGWSWQPRLSVSDGLAKALDANPDLQQYLNDGGITGSDQDSFDAVSVH